MQGGREIAAPIPSRLTVNTSEAAVEAAIAALRHRPMMSYKMEAARRSGALVLLLEDFEKDPLPVHILPRNESQLRRSSCACFSTG